MNTPSRKQHIMVLAAVVAAWLGIGIIDWGMRFRWFRWQDTLVFRPAGEERGPFPSNLVYTNGPYSGGDLTAQVGIPSAAARFEEPRPGSVEWTDEAGYRNQPPVEDTYRLMVLGDSFMNAGIPMTNMFSAWLSSYAGEPVYNHSYPARGPFFGLYRYLYGERFKDPAPRYLVWGLLERDLSGVVFDGMVYQVFAKENPDLAFRPPESGLRWNQFRPSVLRKSLPNSSFVAQAGQKLWNRARYLATGLLPSSIVESLPVDGEPFLFLADSLKAMRWPPEVRDVVLISWAVDYLQQRLDPLGTQLVILLIPDKAQVYRDYLPGRETSLRPPLQHGFLADLETALVEKGLPVINLLPDFLQEAGEGTRLYWRDDTHWRPEGIALAARLVWDKIQELELEENSR